MKEQINGFLITSQSHKHTGLNVLIVSRKQSYYSVIRLQLNELQRRLEGNAKLLAEHRLKHTERPQFGEINKCLIICFALRPQITKKGKTLFKLRLIISEMWTYAWLSCATFSQINAASFSLLRWRSEGQWSNQIAWAVNDFQSA